MGARRGSAAAVAATIVAAVTIAAFGNQWYFEHVLIDGPRDVKAQRLLRVPAAFLWRFSALRSRTSLWAGQLIAIAVVLVLVFVITQALAKRAHGGVLFAGVWGMVIVSAIVGSVVGGWVGYDERIQDPQRLGRFLGPIFDGPNSTVVLWGLIVGLVAAAAAATIGGPPAPPPFVEPAEYIAPPPPNWQMPQTEAPAPLPIHHVESGHVESGHVESGHVESASDIPLPPPPPPT